MTMSMSQARREIAELKARHESDARLIAQNERLARVTALAAEHEPLELALARTAVLVKEVQALIDRGKPAPAAKEYVPQRPNTRQ